MAGADLAEHPQRHDHLEQGMKAYPASTIAGG
jgi:hypothetical protein